MTKGKCVIMRKVAITVGQFIYRKGFDVLLRAWAKVDSEYELYIIGAQPTAEYKGIREKLQLSNVHFEGFKTKEELKCYYQAADLFVFPTREDIWGLVVNEAMSNGLPVITTDKCVAGLELIENGKNGYIVPANNDEELANKIIEIMQNDAEREEMAQYSLEKIRNYTIESMADAHLKALKSEELN
jgi:glycosyltransferase involved in cell wall biosynthesis